MLKKIISQSSIYTHHISSLQPSAATFHNTFSFSCKQVFSSYQAEFEFVQQWPSDRWWDVLCLVKEDQLTSQRGILLFISVRMKKGALSFRCPTWTTLRFKNCCLKLRKNSGSITLWAASPSPAVRTYSMKSSLAWADDDLMCSICLGEAQFCSLVSLRNVVNDKLNIYKIYWANFQIANSHLNLLFFLNKIYYW